RSIHRQRGSMCPDCQHSPAFPPTRTRLICQTHILNPTLRIEGAVDQHVLRNLLIWHNHVIGTTADRHGGAVDIAFVLANACGDESRLFELISVTFMLERIRNISVFWGEKSAEAAVPTLTSNAVPEARRTRQEAWD